MLARLEIGLGIVRRARPTSMTISMIRMMLTPAPPLYFCVHEEASVVDQAWLEWREPFWRGVFVRGGHVFMDCRFGFGAMT